MSKFRNTWQTIIVCAFAATLALGVLAGCKSADKPAAADATATKTAAAAKPVYAKDSCCAKAVAAGKTCDHPCCAAAAKDGKVCAKCNAPG